MDRTTRQRAGWVAVLCLAACGCRLEALMAAEAREALEEIVLQGQAVGVTDGTVEIARHFTIGQAAETVAAELRGWTTASGTWSLGIDRIEIRWVDPVPQSGTLELDAPFDKSATLGFSRVDANTITVTFSSGRVDFSFRVASAGTISGG